MRRPETGPDRVTLVQQKADLLAEMAALRRRHAAAEASSDTRRGGELRVQLQSLMSEERRLRLLIDRSRRQGEQVRK